MTVGERALRRRVAKPDAWALASAPSLAERAYELLRKEIVFCRLAPGDIVTAGQLQELVGLGASPVREALARLSIEGLVDALPRAGYRITPVTLAGIVELFEAWEIVEPAVARLAAGRIDEEELRQLRAGLERQSQARRAGPGDLMGSLDDARHQWAVISRAAGNEHLRQMYLQLETQQVRLFYLVDRAAEASHLPTIEEAEALIAAFERRDGDAVYAQVTGFIQKSREQILQIGARLPSVMSAEIIASNPT